MALFRALESCRRPPQARLFVDRFAAQLLPRSMAWAAQLAVLPLIGRIVPWVVDRHSPGARSSGVARTRLIDDALGAAAGEGVRQVVLLGAGFDCRAHRLPSLAAARVFEVDHPDTLAAKRARLAALDAGSVDGRVTYAGADLNRQALDAVLTAAGVDRAARTFFIWEGVTNYLTATAVDATLRAVAGWAPGSLLLFTYVHRGVIDGSTIFADNVRLKRVLAGAGEPWTFGLEPREVRAFLAARGFELLEDLGAEQYRARYLGAVGAHQRGYQFYRAALARVQPICA